MLLIINYAIDINVRRYQDSLDLSIVIVYYFVPFNWWVRAFMFTIGLKLVNEATVCFHRGSESFLTVILDGCAL